MRTILVTGGCGFIGSNFIRYMLDKYDDVFIINLDALTYCGNLDNLSDINGINRYKFIQGDIGDFELVSSIFQEFKPDIVVNFAAESHNDRAVLNPRIFLETNVLGTQNLLEVCKKFGIKRFHHISTCEVFGDLDLNDSNIFTESSPYKPRTPYNASKAAADHVVRVYYHTFGVPITISNCGNNYGHYQYPEKLIPLFVTNALEDKSLPLFKSSQNKREWVYVLDHCAAVDLILQHGKVGESYNIGTGVEKSIEEIAAIILKTLNKPETLKQYVQDRPGHDRRYALEWSKIKNELGWAPKINFEEGIVETILWYKNNPDWWKKLKNRSFKDYYDNYYSKLKL
ncbi:dTDP-glucose 4,6-dehydratase [Candidatus Woesearchaeota archaeon]|nr:dTDP-glucose 4,6-dehydratase [Candidatus Woesearchaeota archaeon]